MSNDEIHPLVSQLWFARRELQRCLTGLPEADATKRLGPMNSISWMVGHLTDQEHRYWGLWAQGKMIAPHLNELVGFGKPASTPPLSEMWGVWEAVTAVADDYLRTITVDSAQTFFTSKSGRTIPESVGTLLMRNIYHYWFHIGESHAVRQQLGHPDLPQFVGDMATAVYRPE